MRGERDSCLFAKRPGGTYFHHISTMRRGDTHPKMIGGINGGLVLFEPSADTYTDMMEELKHWRPHTKMAEQEFLSWHWARDGSLNTMHKKYTYQIHQLYFSTPTGTTAGETPSSFSSMVDHPDEIRVFHFSARPPSATKLLRNEHVKDGQQRKHYPSKVTT